MLRGEDQLRDARGDIRRGTGAAQRVGGPRGAPLLGVARARLVDRVVEPERELDLEGPLGELARAVVPVEALREVLERVVRAVRLAVASAQRVVDAGGRRDAEPAPGRVPALRARLAPRRHRAASAPR